MDKLDDKYNLDSSSEKDSAASQESSK
jgi:hypothetical protein